MDRLTKMNQLRQRNHEPSTSLLPIPLVVLFNLLTLALISMSLVACGQPQPNKDNSKDSVSSSTVGHGAAPILDVPTVGATGTPGTTGTAVPTGTPNLLTPMVATHVVHATRIASFRQALRTSVALTHEPTDTPGLPPALPSPTPVLGMLPGCSNSNTYEPQGISCWRGMVSGQLIDVASGREGRAGDPTQGMIRVHVRGQQGDSIYRTPNRVGAVRIVSVTGTITGTLFTLATVDLATPQIFGFNLVTRQWVSP